MRVYVNPRREGDLRTLLARRFPLRVDGRDRDLLELLGGIVRRYDRVGYREQLVKDAKIQLALTSPLTVFGVPVPLWMEAALDATWTWPWRAHYWREIGIQLEADALGITRDEYRRRESQLALDRRRNNSDGGDLAGS